VLHVIESLLQPESGGKGREKVDEPARGTASPAVPEPSDQQLAEEFKANMPSTLTRLRTLHSAVLKAPNDDQRLATLLELLQCTREVTGASGMVGFTQLGQMSEVLEALIQELHEKPKNLNPSTLRTLASGIDLMATLAQRREHIASRNGSSKVLVVDDDALSRRAVTYSLEKARLGSTAVESPTVALELLARQPYDLVVLDVDMPEVNGFEVCSRLRKGDTNRLTPVVFVTALNNFETRANSTMSGGNDFIGKPFLFIELAAKALVHIWRSRLQPVN
jgi:CheY-like chemotaxis protein